MNGNIYNLSNEDLLNKAERESGNYVYNSNAWVDSSNRYGGIESGYGFENQIDSVGKFDWNKSPKLEVNQSPTPPTSSGTKVEKQGSGWVPNESTKDKDKDKGGVTQGIPWMRYGSTAAVPRSSGYNNYGFNYDYYNSPVAQYIRSYDPGKPLEYKAVPTFAVPTYDEARARRMGREQAIPYITEIQNAVNRGVARLFGRDFTPGSREAARGLMSGVGEGINKAQAAGAAYGRQAYGDIYNREYDAARANYAAQVQDVEAYNQRLYNTAMATYQAALRNMMAGQ